MQLDIYMGMLEAGNVNLSDGLLQLCSFMQT